ncbi:MAG: peroxiredoxin [Candidatus Rokubacteria bacterium]|nr:peroxiredoxin [Candidatus Rokubacteria bacterium]
MKVGLPAPDFALPGVHGGRLGDFRLRDLEGRWVVLFFYPADFSFVCPTEVKGVHAQYEDFRREDAEVLGVSVDPPSLHLEWVKELGGVAYPLLSDEGREVARLYDVLDSESNRCQRGTYIISPEGRVEYAVLSAYNVGRSVSETLRVLQALRSGRQCPADWHPGDPTPR